MVDGLDNFNLNIENLAGKILFVMKFSNFRVVPKRIEKAKLSFFR